MPAAMNTGASYTLPIGIPQGRATDRVPRRPADRFIALKEVKHLTSLSTATIYRKMAARQFPRSRRIGSRVVWWESAIVGWMDAIDRDQ